MATAMKGKSGNGGSEPSILDYFSRPKRKQAPKSRATPPSFGTPATPRADVSDAVNNVSETPASVVSDDSVKRESSGETNGTGGCKPRNIIRPHLGTPEGSTPMGSSHEPNTPPSPSTGSPAPGQRRGGQECVRLSANSIETPPSNDTHMTTPPSPPTPDTWRVAVQKENVSNYTTGNGGDRGAPESLLETDDGRARRQSETANMGTPSTACTPSMSSSANNNFFRKYTASSNPSNKANKARNVDQRTSQPVKTRKKQKQQSNQMFLDFGQNSFGKRSICSICGMLRVHGMDEDDAEHAKICKEYREGVACGGWKNERSVATFGKDRILEVRPEDAQQHRKKVTEVKAIVDKELGFANRSNEAHPGAAENMTSYMFISSKRVVGLLTVKRIQRAYEYLPGKGGDDVNVGNSSSISRSLKPSRALLGVHQIWVHKSHRQRGIASKLVTAARDNLIFGMTVPFEMVAFSSPTDEGLRFAKGYIGTERPLIYDIH